MAKRPNSDEGAGNGTSGSKKAKEVPPICNACNNERSPSCRFPVLPPTGSCAHAPQTCRPCLRRWIDSQVEENGPLHIRCPDCTKTLTGTDVTASAFKATADKVHRFRNRAELEKVPGLIWCLNPRCDSGQVHSGGVVDPRFDCKECGYSACINCKVPWHTNESCSQFRARRGSPGPEENASELAVARRSKRCPNTECNRPITKAAGCDHIKCSVCQTEFCWSCLATFTARGARVHASSCMHFVRPESWAVREQSVITFLEHLGGDYRLERSAVLLRQMLGEPNRATRGSTGANNHGDVNVQGEDPPAYRDILRQWHESTLDDDGRARLVSLRAAIERHLERQLIGQAMQRHLELRRAALARERNFEQRRAAQTDGE